MLAQKAGEALEKYDRKQQQTNKQIMEKYQWKKKQLQVNQQVALQRTVGVLCDFHTERRPLLDTSLI